MNEVEFDSLRHDEDGRMLHQGHLFTGTAVKRRSNGQLATQMSYVDGIEDGWVRGWHENGILRKETFYREGCAVGVRREWYANGQLKVEAEIEHGFCLWEKEWNETGDLVNDYVLTEDHIDYQLLQQIRERERSKTD